MKQGMKIAIVIVIIVIVAIVAVSAFSIKNEDSSNELKLNTTDNFTKAQEIASQQNKSVLLVLSSDTCHWCDQLKKDTLNDSRVIEKLDQKYVTAIVNVDKQPDIAKTFNAVGTPIVMLFDNNGTQKARIDGYCGPEELMEYL